MEHRCDALPSKCYEQQALDSLATILSSLCAIFLCLLQFEWGSNDNLLGKIHNGFS